MVPYVRKSFYKHWVDGMKYIEGIDEFRSEELKSLSGESPIDCDEYKEYFPNAYEYAMDMTKREVYQAVEGMYHNLKLIWVA